MLEIMTEGCRFVKVLSLFCCYGKVRLFVEMIRSCWC